MRGGGREGVVEGVGFCGGWEGSSRFFCVHVVWPAFTGCVVFPSCCGLFVLGRVACCFGGVDEEGGMGAGRGAWGDRGAEDARWQGWRGGEEHGGGGWGRGVGEGGVCSVAGSR